MQNSFTASSALDLAAGKLPIFTILIYFCIASRRNLAILNSFALRFVLFDFFYFSIILFFLPGAKWQRKLKYLVSGKRAYVGQVRALRN